MKDRKPDFIRLVKFRKTGEYVLRGYWEEPVYEESYLRDSASRYITKKSAIIARDKTLGGIPLEWQEKH